MKKNFKFMLVALLAVFGFGNAMAAALEGTTQYANNGLQYTILSLDKTAGTYTVSVSQSDWNTKAADVTTLTIPATVTFSLTGEDHNGDAVNEEVTFNVITIEADAFKGLSKITSVSLPSSITTIQAGAFEGTSIADLDLSTTSIIVLNKLFEDNNVKLNSVELPATLVSLADNALANCIQLSSVDFSLCTALTTLGDGSLSNTIVDTYDFSNCYTLNTTGDAYLSFLNFTTTQNPFVNATTTTNKNLETVILPMDATLAFSPVNEIGTVFANCEVLTTITNLEVSSITTVADGAFEEDINLTSLEFPTSLTAVNGSPFKGCVKLAELTFNNDGTALTIGDAANNIFGTTLDALTTLKVVAPATDPLTTANVSIATAALTGCTNITTLEFAKDGIFSGDIATFALKETEDATITFGNIAAGTTIATITGPTGTKTTALTIGDYAMTAAAAIVDGIVSKATVGAITDGSILDAIGQAKELEVTGAVTAIAAPTAPNAVLTTINFNDVTIPAGAIATGAFDETNAPALTDVTWTPADDDATAAFAQDAFGAASVGAAAKVTLHTTTAVGDGEYALNEANLYNVIFDATAAVTDPETITVLGNASATFYYGKAQFAAPTKIAKETADGEQVAVYSAFVDASDNKIYMDQLAIVDGYFVVAANKPVVIRMKSPKAPVDMTEEDAGYVEGGKKATVVVEDAAGADPTMRYDNGGNIVNELEINNILYSSDYIGTNFVGKTLYAMKNPAKVGIMDFGKVNKKSYLPAGSLYVQTDETISAARLEVVWLDGSDATAIQSIIEKKGAESDVIYNLAGQKVGASYKGIVIKNGKKMIQK